MNKAGRYVMNALILSGCTLLMRTVGVAFNAFCIGRVGGEGMGLYSLVMSVYGFAVTVATSGVNLAATRLVALHFGKNEGASVRSAMGKCFLYAALFGAFATVTLFFFADFIAEEFLTEPRAGMSIRALSLSLLPLSLCSAFSGYFSAVRRVYKNAVSQVLEQAIRIFACAFLLAIFLPRGVEFACLALVLGGSISEIASFFLQTVSYLSDRRKLTGGGKPVRMRAVAEISLPVAFSAYVRSGLVTVEHILIPIGLAAYGDASALATYGIVSTVALPTVLYPSAFVGAFAGLMIPEVTELSALGREKRIGCVAAQSYSITLFFSILCAGMFSAFASDICRVIYGADTAAGILRALAPLMPVMFLDTVTDAFLKGLGKQFYSMCINIADAALSVLLVWLLVPKMGTAGYVVVIYVTECFNTAASVGKLLSLAQVELRPYKLLFAPLAAAVGAANLAKLLFTALSLPCGAPALVLECLVFTLFYFAIARLLGAVGAPELAFCKNLFARKEKSSFHSGANVV